MHDTSASLLERVRNPRDATSWQRFADLYSPLLHYWLRRHHVLPQDADDLVQEILTVTARKLPDFQYDREQGRFRGWLRGIVGNVLRNFWRAQKSLPTATGDSDFLSSLDQLEDPASDLARAWDLAHDQHVLLGTVEALAPEFAMTTVAAFRRLVLEGAQAALVAEELQISPNAVLVAKSRFLKRLRQELSGLSSLDD